MFWYKQKSAPEKKNPGALGARSEACSLTTTLGHRNPPPTPPHGISGCPTSVAGVRGLYNRFSCVSEPSLAVSEPKSVTVTRSGPSRAETAPSLARMGTARVHNTIETPNGPSSPNLTHP
jgi:hypothetical protein